MTLGEMPLSELLKLYDIDQSEIGVAHEGQQDETEECSADEGVYSVFIHSPDITSLVKQL